MKKDLNLAAWGETWLHELLHACWKNTGLPHLMNDDQEETVIRSLSPVLYAALKRNGLAFRDPE